MIAQTKVRNRLAVRRPVSVEDILHSGATVGLTIVGEIKDTDPLIKQVRRLVKWWDWNLAERVVSLRALTWALAQDNEMRSVKYACDLYTSSDAYLPGARWTLVFVLNHLEDSGLALVRIPA